MDKVRNTIKNRFDREPAYNEKYLKTKTKSYEGKINTNFHNDKMPKEDYSCVCLSVILIDSVFKIFKNNCPQMFLKEFNNIVKEKEVTRHITAEPEWWFFFLSGFSFTDTDDLQDSRGREGTIFYSTLPLPPAHEHSDIYMQLCIWDDYHIFLIAPFVFTRLLLDEIYHLIELPFDWLMMWH